MNDISKKTNYLSNKIFEILKKKKVIDFEFIEDSLEISHEDFSAAIDKLQEDGKIEIDGNRELIRLKKDINL